MRTLPVFLCLEGRRCVVVGADAPAASKAAACLGAGAEVTIVAPALGPEAEALGGRVRHLPRAYRRGDLAGAVLAYASTHEPDLIGRLAAEAADERVLLNVIDEPEACAFLSPAVLERGELKIAIGTGGASPGLASRLRRALETDIGPEYTPFVAILAAVRRRLGPTAVAALLASPLLEAVRRGRREEVDALLGRVAGDGVNLEQLGVALGET
jgi:precorrin-2 dehydrogenase/sirohydrochlorin ferrochelatase